MTQKINGALFRALIDSGIRNLALHGKEVNDLNVFPVPDGDTGTNMVLTLKNGFRSIEDNENAMLPDMAKALSSAVLYGARGNSGVIISRFFKGFSETFCENGQEEADLNVAVAALERGTAEAYRAVSCPTEGTMLTVLREATDKVTMKFRADNSDLKELLAIFIDEARISLKHTPELLPVLKNAGVVDSGGAGVVYVFDGMYKYLRGEAIGDSTLDIKQEKAVDYELFDENSDFSYGYCTEFLLQLTKNGEEFNPAQFKEFLETNGDSVATFFDKNKVKVHVHTNKPEKIMMEAHRFGEFLSLKIENMSVQHTEIAKSRNTDDAAELFSESNEAVLCLPSERKEAEVGVVVCAPGRKTVELFQNMGADAVIYCPVGISPTTKNFADAIEAIGTKNTIIFPNNGNNILPAQKVVDMLGEEYHVEIADSKSVSECYAALAILDYEGTLSDIAEEAEQAIASLFNVTVMQAVKNATFDDVEVKNGDFLAMHGNDVIAADEELWELVKRVMNIFVEKEDREPDAITVFTGKNTPDGLSDMISKRVERKYKFTETDVVITDSETYDLILSFE